MGVNLLHVNPFILYKWVKRGNVRVKCLAQEHNRISVVRARTGPLDPKTSTLTMRQPLLDERLIDLH